MKEFRCIYDGDSFIDGIDCDTIEEAQNYARDILIEWATTYESDEDHNMMVENCMTWVEQYDPKTDEWEDIWYPEEEFLESIGFTERIIKS